MGGLDEGTVAAPVGVEGAYVAPLGGGEVGGDVAAAEGVDGLLGVADQHQRAGAVEGPVEHVPLHRVGVLELVDHDDRPPVAHPLPRRCVVVGECLGQPAEQVVEAQHAEPALAALELVQHLGGEADPRRRGRARVGLLRGQRRVGVADDVAGERPGLGPGEGRGLAVLAEAGEVEVVDDLGHQVVEALDQRQPRLGVTGDPQGAQHQLAELVGGGDGRGVEGRERLTQPSAAEGELRRRRRGQVAEQRVVVGDQGGVVERVRGRDERAPHPFPQLLAGRPTERDEQHVVEPGVPLGDVAGDQPGEGEGLAGAGTGLEDGGRAGSRQLAGEVERRRRRGHHRLLSARRSGPHSLTDSAPRRWGWPRSSSSGRTGPSSVESGACWPQTRTWPGRSFSPG